jgi:hypothetical protein
MKFTKVSDYDAAELTVYSGTRLFTRGIAACTGAKFLFKSFKYANKFAKLHALSDSSSEGVTSNFLQILDAGELINPL